MNLREHYETFSSEGLKTAVERTLGLMGGNIAGNWLLEHYAGGLHRRILDERLQTIVAGVDFENPIIVGAGWDKQGRAIHGLYALNFAGVEVGTVPPLYQFGGPKPRLWTIDSKHSVAMNALGFDSPGEEVVGQYLEDAQPLPCPIGLNVGRNKKTPNNLAAQDHERVISRLGKYASYIVLGISSINTPGLRDSQQKEPLRELLQSAREAKPESVPLFIKIDGERSKQELTDIVEVCIEEAAAGIVAINSYGGRDLKQKYGERWAKQPGGLSGADQAYRALATVTIRHIYEEAGDTLAIIGAGGVDSPEAALAKMKAGASAVQVVTAIRPSKGKVAARINQGLLDILEAENIESVRKYIGTETERGALYA